MKLNSSDIAYLIAEIKKTNYKLNPWESKFMKSMSDRCAAGYSASEKQGEVLQRIYRYSQGGGIYERSKIV